MSDFVIYKARVIEYHFNYGIPLASRRLGTLYAVIYLCGVASIRDRFNLYVGEATV